MSGLEGDSGEDLPCECSWWYDGPWPGCPEHGDTQWMARRDLERQAALSETKARLEEAEKRLAELEGRS